MDLITLIEACTILHPELDNTKSVSKAADAAQELLDKLERYKEKYYELKEEQKNSVDKSEIEDYLGTIEDMASDLEYKIRQVRSSI